MNLQEKTFGSTPAAMYLVRTLNELGNQTLSRSVGKRITATNSAVSELVYAYEASWISAKVLANTMRMMREEVTNECGQANSHVHSKEALVDKLRRNVQIGYIKKAIRQATVARKCETVMAAPNRKGICYSAVGDMQEIAYFDNQLDKYVQAGWVSGDRKLVQPVLSEEVETVTPQLLHDRSDRRCRRLGKAHMKDVV